MNNSRGQQPKHRARPAASLGNLKAGLLDFWAFAKRAGFCEVARDLLLAALIAGIGL
ncbi:hypothetical protein [uncultured Senegalimassilia sp.]|uniref:hypothetical protein n=1 Tax=uncultured Senegalimassilia sp. TaxID=1714350 RepID=UPI0025EEFFAA|nr:hypothetical protein [uncultured Senegalimassilia sp.]